MTPQVGIVAMVPDRWSAVWQPRHHVLSRLADRYSVVFVEPAPYWRSLFSARGERSPIPPADPPRHLTVYRPEWWLPKLYSPKALARWTFGARVRRARRRLERQGARSFVLYVWRPEFAAAVDAAAFDLVCYHIDDEYSFSRTEQPISPVEQRLLERADRVFIHSPALLEKKGRFNPNTTYAPNGVDYDAHATPCPEPADLAAVPRPRIGYTGRVKRQLDWPLIERLATSRRDWQFVLVGAWAPHVEVEQAAERLKPLGNVHFLGAKPYWELARYPQHFDVCVMPYRRDDYTKFIYPMKVNEFLAGGRPTVGARIRSLEEFSPVVALVESDEEWSAAIEKALGDDERSSLRDEARREVARRHDWATIADAVAGQIDAGLREVS